MQQLLKYLRVGMRSTPLRHRLAKGAAWSLVGSFISRGLGLLAWILVGRLLGTREYGELGVVQSTIGLFGAVAGFGMGMTATKYVAEFRTSDQAKAGRIIGIGNLTTWTFGGLMAIALAIFAPWISTTMLASPQLADLLRIGSLLLLLGAVTSAQSGVLTGFEAFRAVAKINLTIGVLSFPLLLAGAFLWGVAGAVWAMIFVSFIGTLLFWLEVRAQVLKFGVQVSYRRCLSESSIFWKFNVPGVIIAILSASAGWAGVAMLVQYPEGYSDVGVYNAITRIKLMPEALAGMILAPILPILSDAYARSDMDTYGKTLVFTFTVSSLVIVPVSLLQTAFPMLTLLPFGASYINGEPVVPWMMLWTIAYALMWPMSLILISMGRIWLGLALCVLQMTVYFGLTVVLVPKFGVTGFACAGALAFVISNLPCVFLLYREFPALMKETKWISNVLLVLVLFTVSLIACHQLNSEISLIIGALTSAAYIAWQLHSLLSPFHPHS